MAAFGAFSQFARQALERPSQSRHVSADINQLRRATDEEIAAAWPDVIAQYGLQANSDGTPVIDAELVPKVDRKWTTAYHNTLRHDINGERIYGHPGSGLSDSGFGKSQVRSGSRGEEVFAKLLTWDGVLDRCISFWSVWNIEDDGSKNNYGTDIDCVLKFGNHIFLVDVKNYRAGLDYHTLIPGHAMFCVYPVARVVANVPYVFSCNMGIAQKNMSNYLLRSGSHCTVESYVVLVPGQAGEATLDADICWPGGIPAMSYSSFVSMIRQGFSSDPSYASTEPTWEEGYLASLVKLYADQSTLTPNAAADRSLWPRPTCDRAQGIEYPNPKRIVGNKDARDTSRRHDESDNGKRASVPSGTSSRTYRPKFASSSSYRDTKSTVSRRHAANLAAIPAVNSVTMSVTCGRDSAGNSVEVSFKEVSCMTIAGTSRSGEVGRTFALVAALDQSDDVELHVIDCKRTSQFTIFANHVHSYVRMADGLDLVAGEVQHMYTMLNARLRRLRMAGIAGYWSDPDHAGMPLEVLVFHGCEDLFGKFTSNIDDSSSDDDHDADDEKTQLSDIHRYLRKIIDNGVKAGCCVLLSTQNPSAKAFPADLVKYAQIRILYRIDAERQAKAMLHGVSREVARQATTVAMSIGERDFGGAVMIVSDDLIEGVRFYALDAKVIDDRYPSDG